MPLRKLILTDLYNWHFKYLPERELIENRTAQRVWFSLVDGLIWVQSSFIHRRSIIEH